MFRILIFLLLIPWQVWATTTLYVDTDAPSPTHPTYSSLSAAITYLQGYNSGVLDDDFVIECSGTTADTTRLTIDSITVTTTYTLTINGDNYSGKWSDSHYRLVSDWDKILTVAIDVTINRLQIESIGTEAYVYPMYCNTTCTTTISNSYFKNTSTGTFCRVRFDAGTQTIINSVFEGFTNTGLYSQADTTCYNTLFIDNDREGVLGTAVYCYNCMAVNNNVSASGYSDFNVAGGDYNISSDSSAPGTNSLTNQVATDLMTDPTNGDFTLKAGSNAIGAGTDLSSTFTTDITGATRAVPWDIGAFMYAAATTPWRYYNGSAWIDADAYRYDGSAWQPLTTKRYDGTWQ